MNLQSKIEANLQGPVVKNIHGSMKHQELVHPPNVDNLLEI